MNRIFYSIALMAALTGCCSYSQLCRDVGKVRADGKTPIATYEVVNASYKLLGLVPFTTGTTWKEGPYDDSVGGMAFFCTECSLDDNLESVKHACKVVGSENYCDVTAQVEDYWAWSCLLFRKRIVVTSCVIVK